MAKIKLMKFKSPMFGVLRGAYIDGQVWFVGRDVAKALGYKKPENALTMHVDDEDKNTTLIEGSNRGNPTRTLINESGLFSLILRSNMPTAREFKRWVTQEVLPAIRKTGEYRSTWQDKREATKIFRRNLTDAIKKFIGYLKERNELDRPENVWYIIFTKLVNNTLGIKDNRDNLSEEMLDKISRAEDVAARVIEAGMIQEKSHHEIHEACKRQLAAWVILDDLKNLFKE